MTATGKVFIAPCILVEWQIIFAIALFMTMMMMCSCSSCISDKFIHIGTNFFDTLFDALETEYPLVWCSWCWILLLLLLLLIALVLLPR